MDRPGCAAGLDEGDAHFARAVMVLWSHAGDPTVYVAAFGATRRTAPPYAATIARGRSRSGHQLLALL